MATREQNEKEYGNWIELPNGSRRYWRERRWMMITRQTVSERLLAYLNNQLPLEQLVAWAEGCMVQGGFAPDSDIDVLVDIVMYLAGADRPQFPLTWDVCSDFMTQLGRPVKVVPVDAA